MANNKFTYQQQRNVSIPRDALINIASLDLGKKDYKVLVVLFTQLDGWGGGTNDPLNYKKIDINSIAQTLSLKKKDVRASIDTLLDEGLIELGDNDTVRYGYRFTF